MEQLSQIPSLLSLHKEGLDAKVLDVARHRPRKEWEASASASARALHPVVQQRLHAHLFKPAQELRQRPSHSFRSQLVDLGFTLVSGAPLTARDRCNLDLCAESIESLHLGSLIVDDIQDGSEVRRSGEALHRLLGVPQALGVGNWLYFYALRTLSGLNLSEPQRNALYEIYLEAVELAHYGQIMDLCIKVDQVPYAEIEVLSQECMRYKTGSIVMLALVMGALAGGADHTRLRLIEQLGYALGIYLQRLNDLGNSVGSFDPEKQWEDLLNWKPSYVWGFAARQYGPDAVRELIEAVRALPDASAWQAWLERHDLVKEAKAMAERDLDQALRDFKNAIQVSWSDLRPLVQLKERIQKAYG